MYFKIRAWDKKRKIMYYPRSLRFNKRTGELELIDRNTNYCQYGKYEEIVLMVSIGLKDINGKEIYEGDIVDVYSFDNHFRRGIVGWYPLRSCFVVEFIDTHTYTSLGSTILLYVRGNIYENSDLLNSI